MSLSTFAVRCSAFVTSHDVPKLNQPLKPVEEKEEKRLCVEFLFLLAATRKLFIHCPPRSSVLHSHISSPHPSALPPNAAHCSHWSSCAASLETRKNAAAAATCQAHGSSLAPPPPQPSQHERRLSCCSHISPQDTCPVMLSQPRPRPPACLPSLHVDANACRPPVVIVCAGRWQTPPACRSADQ